MHHPASILIVSGPSKLSRFSRSKRKAFISKREVAGGPVTKNRNSQPFDDLCDGWIKRQMNAVAARPRLDPVFEQAAGNGLQAIARQALQKGWTPAATARSETDFLSDLVKTRLERLCCIDLDLARAVLRRDGDFLKPGLLEEIEATLDHAEALARAEALAKAVTRCPDPDQWEAVGDAAASYEFHGDEAFRALLAHMIGCLKAKHHRARMQASLSASNRLLKSALADRAATSLSELLARGADHARLWSTLIPVSRAGLLALIEDHAKGKTAQSTRHARRLWGLANGLRLTHPHHFCRLNLAAAPLNLVPAPWRLRLIEHQQALFETGSENHRPENAAALRHHALMVQPLVQPHGIIFDL